MNPAVIVPVALALITPVVTYIVAARRMSGRIATSDASELWTEAREIREDYRRQLEEANARAVRLEERMARLEEINNKLARENIDLLRKIAGLEAGS